MHILLTTFHSSQKKIRPLLSSTSSSYFLFLSPVQLIICQGKSGYPWPQSALPGEGSRAGHLEPSSLSYSLIIFAVWTEDYTYSMHMDTFWLKDWMNYNILMCSQIVQNGESIKNCDYKLNILRRATLVRLWFYVGRYMWLLITSLK